MKTQNKNQDLAYSISRRIALTNFVKETFRNIEKEMNNLWKVLKSEDLIK